MEAYGLSIEHVHVVSPVDEWHVAQTPSDRVVHLYQTLTILW